MNPHRKLMLVAVLAASCTPSLIWVQEAPSQTPLTSVERASDSNKMPFDGPELIVSDMILSDAAFGDGDGIPEGGEVAEVTLTVTNAGNAAAFNGTLSAEWIAAIGDFEWIVGNVDVGRISPGHSRQLAPLSFQVNTDEQFTIGTYELTYSQSDFDQVVGQLTVYANPLDYTSLHITGHPTWNMQRDERYLAYIDRISLERLWVKDLDTGDLLFVDGNMASILRMTLHDGWLAYTTEEAYGWLGSLRVADAATGEVTEIAAGTDGWEMDASVRPAMSDRYLLWNGSGSGVLDGLDLDHVPGAGWDAEIFPDFIGDPPAETGPHLRVMDRTTGRHRRLGSDDFGGEWCVAVAGHRAAYVSDFTAHLQNLDTGEDIALSAHHTDHVSRVGISEEYVVWSTLYNELFIRELSTGEEREVALPEGVELYASPDAPIEVGHGWIALSGDYFGVHHLFLVRLSDDAIVPVAREFPYDSYGNASLYGNRLVYTWGTDIREEVLPVGGQIAATATDADGIASEFTNCIEVQTALADAVGATNTMGDGAELALATNVPNPFRRATRIDYVVDRAGTVDLAIYDVSGRLVRTLVHRESTPAAYSTRWDGTDDGGAHVTAGVYFYRLTVEGRSTSRSALLLR